MFIVSVSSKYELYLQMVTTKLFLSEDKSWSRDCQTASLSSLVLEQTVEHRVEWGKMSQLVSW